ncbi:MAG: VWA domain-containing protein, partial [Caulobacteraceae bacterium]|nr:VWA domain-containing protein [Caulobacteraceae bacterium]
MTAPARRVVEDFIRALRATEVRVSPAEAIDAHRAAALAGWSNRTLLRDALCVTLAKSSEEVSRFEAAFDTFFARDALAGGRDQGDASNPQAGNTLEEQILAGDEAGLALAMEGAAAEVGAGDIQLAIQRSPLVRRMLDAMGLRALELSIQRRVDAGDVEGARELADGRRALFKRARAFIDRQSRLYAGESGRRLREAILAGQPFGQIPPQDIAAMTRLVKRLARRLADRYARRRRRALKGHLDARATLRRSLVHGGLPFDLVWKSRRRERPKLVAIVDVSRSVAAAAGFLLLFLHSLNEVVERLDAFAFSDRLVRVNDL